MKIKIFFLISAMNALSYSCFENCCVDCWDNCVEKEEKVEKDDEKNENEEKGENGNKEENDDEFFLEEEKGEEKKKEAENLVNEKWVKNKKPNLKLYKKTELVEEGKIKVTKYKNGEIKVEKFSPETNTQKWALFEIKYKKEGEEKGEEEGKFVYLYCSDIESVGINGMFKEKENILNISVLACDTSEVKNMSCMFYKCFNLKNLDLFNFDTRNVTNMRSMFSKCSNLEEIKGINNFDTSNVKNMNFMFNNCSELGDLDLSKFDTSNVTDMDWMFENCNKLKNVTVSKNENTQNKILTQLNKDIKEWEVKEEDDKFILTKVEEKK